MQICFVDHSGPAYTSPHIHVQCLFSDQSRSPWLNFPGSNAMALRQACANLRGPGQGARIRLHRHEQGESEAPNGGAANKSVVSAIPRLVLSERAAARLAAEGHETCPYCLEAFSAGEEVMAMPCAGTHVAHADCTTRWLAVGSTCPTCRFALPKRPTATEIADLVVPAQAELARLDAAGDELPLICQDIDDEDAVDAAVQQAHATAAAAVGSFYERQMLAASEADADSGRASEADADSGSGGSTPPSSPRPEVTPGMGGAPPEAPQAAPRGSLARRLWKTLAPKQRAARWPVGSASSISSDQFVFRTGMRFAGQMI